MPSNVTWYHGTSKWVVAHILQQGAHSFLPSTNSYDWLGTGIYFWEAGPERAKMWAQAHHGSQAAVLAAEIQLDDCLDLYDLPGKQKLIDSYTVMSQMLQAQNQPLPSQTPTQHGLDNAVIEYHVQIMSQQGDRVRCVRSPFDEGLPIYPDSAFTTLSHVQIAVRDPFLITRMWEHL